MRVGLISDTHGVFDDRVFEAFEGVSAIVHAGDIGGPDIMWKLEAIAPVHAVLGNCDYEVPGYALDGLARFAIAGVRFVLLHDLGCLGPIPDDVDVVVCGHSHAPRNEWHGGVLVVNPGSASQRRRQPSRSVAILELGDGEPRFELVALDEIEPPAR